MSDPGRSVRRRRFLALTVAGLSVLASGQPAAAPRTAATGPCGGPLADPIVHVPMPGHPFQVQPSPDGCWFYVSINSAGPRSLNGIAVLKRERGSASLVRVVPVEPEPAGMVLTRNGEMLIVSDGDAIVFLDTARMRSGKGDPILGYFSDGEDAGSVYLNCTRDDHWLFVSDEYAQAITVIDLERARSAGYRADAIVGRIPVGRAPVALTFSPDERYLFTTSQVAPKNWGWSAECAPEGEEPGKTTPGEPMGAVIVIDVERAKRDPSNAVVSRVPAGCHPLRLVISEGGDMAFVTARKTNALLAFDTAKLPMDSTHAGIGSVPVGPAPVGVAVARAGGREIVVVANSNRFASAGVESLTVVDAGRIRDGAAAVVGRIPAGKFPRELRVIDGGRTLVVTNFLSDDVQLVDLQRLSFAPPKH